LSATTRSTPERLFQRSGPERFLQIRVPALSTTRPMGFACLLTNEELLSKLGDTTPSQTNPDFNEGLATYGNETNAAF
jgi:hypothetical protein